MCTLIIFPGLLNPVPGTQALGRIREGQKVVLTNRHGELFIDSKSAGKPRTPVPVRRNHPPPLTPAPVRFNRPTVQDALPRTFISSFNVVPSRALLHIAMLLPCRVKAIARVSCRGNPC